MPKVADIVRIFETLAPRRLAEQWDNVGLQVGDPGWPADHLFIALDPTPAAISAAAAAGADLLLTHHPLLFKPIKKIDFSSPVGKTVQIASRKRISIFSAHTNLDSAAGGVNDVLAETVGLSATRPLAAANAPQVFKLVLFVPVEHAGRILDILSETPAGRIGNYTACSFHQEGFGRFIPGTSASPHIGTPGKPTQTGEVRIETRVFPSDLATVIERVRRHHPYETMAYDVYPLTGESTGEGIGRVGRLERPGTLSAVAEDIRKRLRLRSVKIAGQPDLPVETAAVCSGSGTGLIGDFLRCGADVYISGDLTHHAAIDVAAEGKGMIDIGHFASERLIVPALRRYLQAALENAGLTARITVWENEPDPFSWIA